MAKKIRKSENGAALVELVVNALLDKKAKDVVSLDLRNIEVAVADYFVIAHGESNTQVNALHQYVLEKTSEAGIKPYHSEGKANGEWIIIDFVDVVVHIFHRDKRDFYQLEDLWHDAVTVKHSDEPKPKKTAEKTTKTKPAAKKAAKAPAKKAAAKKAAPKKDVKKKR